MSIGFSYGDGCSLNQSYDPTGSGAAKAGGIAGYDRNRPASADVDPAGRWT